MYPKKQLNYVLGMVLGWFPKYSRGGFVFSIIVLFDVIGLKGEYRFRFLVGDAARSAIKNG